MNKTNLMNPKFKDFDKNAIKVIKIPVATLNSIFEEAESDLRVLKRHEETSQCTISSKSTEYMPHTVIAGKILGIHIHNWYWDEVGYSVIIEYKERKE